jgi:hypothetical protein
MPSVSKHSSQLSIEKKKSEELLSEEDTDIKENECENEKEIDEKTLRLRTLETEGNTREWLIKLLSRMSIAWLIFTGCIIIWMGIGCCHLADGVAISLIASSSANVLSLWAIGLRYFFSSKKG